MSQQQVGGQLLGQRGGGGPYKPSDIINPKHWFQNLIHVSFFTLLVKLQIFFFNFKYFLQKKCNLDEKINPVGRRGGVHGWLDHQCSAQVGQVAGRLQELGDGGVNRASFTQVELINDSVYKERGSLKPGKNVTLY